VLGAALLRRRRRVARRSALERFETFVASAAAEGIGDGEAEFFAAHRRLDPERWMRHASPTRYGRELSGLFNGITTRRVVPVVSLLAAFAFVLDQYNIMAKGNEALPEVLLPLTPFELTSPLLGLLLVFRTNSSYERWSQGGDLALKIDARFRDLVRGLLSYTKSGLPRKAADVDKACDLAAAYQAWIFQSYLVPNSSKSAEATAQLNAVLNRTGDDLSPVIAQVALSRRINTLPDLDPEQWASLEQLLSSISELLAECEYLIRAPIPLSYTRSTVRFLWLWLSLLPFALVNTFIDFGQDTWWAGRTQLIVPAVTFLIGIIFLSIEDIAVQIEEPFTVQRQQLDMMAQWFVQDLARMRAPQIPEVRRE